MRCVRRSTSTACSRRKSRNAVFLPLHVGADDLAASWAGLKGLRNLDGLVVTMPHKAAAATLVDTLGATARIVGAINAARREPDGRWHGEMFDGDGFVDGLLNEGHAVNGRTAHVLGLGGAGAAIAVALARAGVTTLTVDDLDASRRAQLVREIAARWPGVWAREASAYAVPCDLVINATPLGMREADPLPFEPDRLPASTLVVDIITKPEMTPLLRMAEALGRPVHTGRHMHAGQAMRAARFFGLIGSDEQQGPHAAYAHDTVAIVR